MKRVRRHPPFTTTQALATSAKATGLAPPSIPAHPDAGSCQNLAGSRSELSVLKENFAGFNLSPPATNSVEQVFGRFWKLDSSHFHLFFGIYPRTKVTPNEHVDTVANRHCVPIRSPSSHECVGSYRIKEITNRSPGYSEIANLRARHIGTFRDSRVCDRRSWALRARLNKFRRFDPLVDRESFKVVIFLGKCLNDRVNES
ncbi:unnamed protein product [Prunus armeniaca]